MTEQEMIHKQWEVVRLIEQIGRIFIGHQFDKYEKDEPYRSNAENKIRTVTRAEKVT